MSNQLIATHIVCSTDAAGVRLTNTMNEEVNIPVFGASEELATNGTTVVLIRAMRSQVLPVIYGVAETGAAGVANEVPLLAVHRLHMLIPLPLLLETPPAARFWAGVQVLLPVGVPYMAVPVAALHKASRTFRTRVDPLAVVGIHVVHEGVAPLEDFSTGLAGQLRSLLLKNTSGQCLQMKDASPAGDSTGF